MERFKIFSLGYKGLYLIVFDTDNILKIISLEGKSKAQVEQLIQDEKIRDVVAFQEEAIDKNNHFVKLIINKGKNNSFKCSHVLLLIALNKPMKYYYEITRKRSVK